MLELTIFMPLHRVLHNLFCSCRSTGTLIVICSLQPKVSKTFWEKEGQAKYTEESYPVASKWR
jgi:hypothetical protein